MTKEKPISTKKMVMGALLCAIVVILQFVGSSIKVGSLFSISLVLIPIVIGAITCGKSIGALLGFVFGVTVILSGDATPFMAVNIPGTIITVLLKGILAGFLTGFVYQFFLKITKKKFVSGIICAIICPIVNTGVFLIGCRIFFFDTLKLWAENFGFGNNVGEYIVFGLVGTNFLAELAVNIIFAPSIVHIIKAVDKE